MRGSNQCVSWATGPAVLALALLIPSSALAQTVPEASWQEYQEGAAAPPAHHVERHTREGLVAGGVALTVLGTGIIVGGVALAAGMHACPDSPGGYHFCGLAVGVGATLAAAGLAVDIGGAFMIKAGATPKRFWVPDERLPRASLVFAPGPHGAELGLRGSF